MEPNVFFFISFVFLCVFCLHSLSIGYGFQRVYIGNHNDSVLEKFDSLIRLVFRKFKQKLNLKTQRCRHIQFGISMEFPAQIFTNQMLRLCHDKVSKLTAMMCA